MTTDRVEPSEETIVQIEAKAIALADAEPAMSDDKYDVVACGVPFLASHVRRLKAELIASRRDKVVADLAREYVSARKHEFFPGQMGMALGELIATIRYESQLREPTND